MTKSVKPVLQMLLDSEPLSLAEVKEMALRHVLASPSPTESNNMRITTRLLDIFWLVAARDKLNLPAVEGAEEVDALLKHNFVLACAQAMKIKPEQAAAYWTRPPALPRAHSFPKDFIVQLGAALGTKVGSDLVARNN